MHDILLKEQILSLTKKQNFFNLIILKTVNSTNSYAKELARGSSPHATVVVADEQTNGRGRLGREFFSPEGTGIYMSIILKPNEIKIPSSHLTITAGVAVCRVLSNVCDSYPRIKWVNDVFVNEKKVCGILAEGLGQETGNNPHSVILGIGLNVSTPSDIFPGKLSKLAGSVFPKSISRNELIAKILDELDSLCNSESIDRLISEYKRYSLILNKNISFTKDGKAYVGVAVDINNEGNLVVELDDKQKMILSSGEVSLGSSNFLN